MNLKNKKIDLKKVEKMDIAYLQIVDDTIICLNRKDNIMYYWKEQAGAWEILKTK